MEFKRATFALYCLHDRGDESGMIYAFSALTGRAQLLELETFRFLARVPGQRWASQRELRRLGIAQRIDWLSLAEAGLLLVRGSGVGSLDELLRRHHQLDSDAWNGISATYHFMARWQDAHLLGDGTEEDRGERDWGRLDAEEGAAFMERHGPAPAHFHEHPGAEQSIPMPEIYREGGLYQALLRRRTTRDFDSEKKISSRELAILLKYAFGCHGTAPMFQGVDGVKRTSPSGGGLHPIEIYALVLNAEGLKPGLYHYNLARHSLDRIEALEEDAARELAYELTAGQRYAADAGVLFLMTARFFRNFWKYRRHEKAYGVLLMDAAHLSQTFYLLCADLGLGAFFTAAVNGANIERSLGLDGYQEGALAICGCGHFAAEPGDSAPRFRPYRPGLEGGPSSEGVHPAA